MPVITDEGLGKSMMLTSAELMTQFLQKMRRFDTLTWDDIEDIITVGVWDATTQESLFNSIDENRGKFKPSETPNLKRLLRVHVPASFHIADREGGVTGIGSIVMEPQTTNVKDWGIYDRNAPSILTWNFREGQFGRISGVPGSGKTNVGCSILENTNQEGNTGFSNIYPDKGNDERYYYVRDAKSLFENIAELNENEKWTMVLDEAGLMYSKPDQATRRVKDLDKLMRVVRKLHGSIVLIEQRPESVPNIIQDFATCIFYCIKPGVVHIDLRGPTIRFSETVMNFPKSSIGYKTYDIGFFSVNVNVTSMFAAMSGEEDPKKAMLDWIDVTNPAGDQTPEEMAAVNTKIDEEGPPDNCVRCGKTIDREKRPRSRYCSDYCNVQSSVNRIKSRDEAKPLEIDTE